MHSAPIRILALSALLVLMIPSSFAETMKIGYINTERVVREAPASILAGKNIEAEFGSRDKEIKRLAADLASRETFIAEKAITLSDSQRRAKETEISELNLLLQRRQREFQEDLKVRQTEVTSAILEKANLAIKRVAENERLDMVIQDAVWVSKGMDITDRVLKMLTDENGS